MRHKINYAAIIGTGILRMSVRDKLMVPGINDNPVYVNNIRNCLWQWMNEIS